MFEAVAEKLVNVKGEQKERSMGTFKATIEHSVTSSRWRISLRHSNRAPFGLHTLGSSSLLLKGGLRKAPMIVGSESDQTMLSLPSIALNRPPY